MTRVREIGGNYWVVDERGNPIRKVTYWCINSSEPRPTYADGVRDMDVLIVKDTAEQCFFDEVSMGWCEV